MANYVTTAEVRAFKVQGEVIGRLIAYTDAEIEIELTLAEEFIELITNNWFYSKTLTTFLDGNGLFRMFFFPEIVAPAIALTEVLRTDDDGTTKDTYVEGTDYVLQGHYFERILGEAYSVRDNYFNGGVWVKGQKNIKVTGTFGTADVDTPAAISRATLLLALERMFPGSTGIVTTDVSQAVWSDFTVTFRAAGIEQRAGMSTGFEAVDRLLEPYVNYVDMFMVVPDTKQTHDNSIYREQ